PPPRKPDLPASLNVRPLVDIEAASVSAVAMVVKAVLDRAPAEPVPLVQVAAFQLMSPADQTAAAPAGPVNRGAFAMSSSLNCGEAAASVIPLTETDTGLAAARLAVRATGKAISTGAATRYCSETIAAKSVVRLASGTATTVWANAGVAITDINVITDNRKPRRVIVPWPQLSLRPAPKRLVWQIPVAASSIRFNISQRRRRHPIPFGRFGRNLRG